MQNISLLFLIACTPVEEYPTQSSDTDTETKWVNLPNIDDDGDGLTEEEGDCNDADPSSYPGAPDPLDGLDQDCAGDLDGLQVTMLSEGYPSLGSTPLGVSVVFSGMTASYMWSFGVVSTNSTDHHEDCLTNNCWVLSNTSGLEQAFAGHFNRNFGMSGYWGDLPSTSFDLGQYAEEYTYILRFNHPDLCYVWGVDATYYSGEGCVLLQNQSWLEWSGEYSLYKMMDLF